MLQGFRARSAKFCPSDFARNVVRGQRTTGLYGQLNPVSTPRLNSEVPTIMSNGRLPPGDTSTAACLEPNSCAQSQVSQCQPDGKSAFAWMIHVDADHLIRQLTHMESLFSTSRHHTQSQQAIHQLGARQACSHLMIPPSLPSDVDIH